MKSLRFSLGTVLAAIATHVAVVSVFVAALLFRDGQVDVSKLAQGFGYAGALCQLDVIQLFGGVGGVPMEFPQAGLRAGEVIHAKNGYDLKRSVDRRLVLGHIRRTCARWVTLEPPCTLWGQPEVPHPGVPSGAR